MNKYLKLLEVYGIEEILDNIGLEQWELLELLEDQGYEITLREPL